MRVSSFRYSVLILHNYSLQTTSMTPSSTFGFSSESSHRCTHTRGTFTSDLDCSEALNQERTDSGTKSFSHLGSTTLRMSITSLLDFFGSSPSLYGPRGR